MLGVRHQEQDEITELVHAGKQWPRIGRRADAQVHARWTDAEGHAGIRRPGQDGGWHGTC